MSELLSFVLSQGDQFRRQRLASLYSDFTLQRHFNPDGYVANTSSWINVLEQAARAGFLPNDGGSQDYFTLTTGDALLRSLETPEWGRPLALGAVVDEAVSQHRMMLLADFITARKSLYSRGFTVHPGWLLSWSLHKIGFHGLFTGTATLSKDRYVILSNVEDTGDVIVKQIGNASHTLDRIFPMTRFREEVAKIVNPRGYVSDIDLQILLTHLSRDKAAIVYDSQTVKFQQPGEKFSTLSEQDRTISSLKSIIPYLNNQIQELSIRIAALSEKVTKALQNKNRPSALAALRSRKLNEAALEERSRTLAQLEEVYNKIAQAADQIAIVRTLEASSTVLRNLHADVGGVDRVEGVIGSLREEINKVDEISNALEAGGSAENILDQDAVEDELEDMARQAELDKTKAREFETQQQLASIEDIDKRTNTGNRQQNAEADFEISPSEESIAALKGLSLENGETYSRRGGADIHASAQQEANVG